MPGHIWFKLHLAAKKSSDIALYREMLENLCCLILQSAILEITCIIKIHYLMQDDVRYTMQLEKTVR